MPWTSSCSRLGAGGGRVLTRSGKASLCSLPAFGLFPPKTCGRPRPHLHGGGWDLHALGEMSAVPWRGSGRAPSRQAWPLQRQRPHLLATTLGHRGLTLRFSLSALFPSALARLTCVLPSWSASAAGVLSCLFRSAAAAAAPVSSVSRLSSHDFSFCLSDSFKQKHTSKAPQRGSSLNFSDFWFSCPCFPPLLFLPFSSPVMLSLNL